MLRMNNFPLIFFFFLIFGICCLQFQCILGDQSNLYEQHNFNKFSNAIQDGNLCSGSNFCCNVTSTESCTMNKFPKDQSTLIFPGGETRCIFSYSSPYAFQVIPGDSDNLLIYFQGGGACFDQGSTDNSEAFCITDLYPQYLVGVFDRKNRRNRFRSYTIIHVMYCSGDFHGGNVVRPYPDKAGQPVIQVGLNNVQSALDWVKQQIGSGYLASTFSNLVVMGCSAGSVGTQLWGSEILSQFQWKQAAVVPDSFAGLLPGDSFGQMLYDYGYCASGFLSSSLTTKCINKQLTFDDINLEFIGKNPQVPYAFIESKVDSVQVSFYISVADMTNNSTPIPMNPTEFYTELNTLFGDYNLNRKNFITYLIDGELHCFTDQDRYFTTNTKGITDYGLTTKSPMLYEWVNSLPLNDGQSIDSQCDSPSSSIPSDNLYCSANVVPKSFVEGS